MPCWTPYVNAGGRQPGQKSCPVLRPLLAVPIRPGLFSQRGGPAFLSFARSLPDLLSLSVHSCRATKVQVGGQATERGHSDISCRDSSSLYSIWPLYPLPHLRQPTVRQERKPIRLSTNTNTNTNTLRDSANTPSASKQAPFRFGIDDHCVRRLPL
jgi:hypothetical protein